MLVNFIFRFKIQKGIKSIDKLTNNSVVVSYSDKKLKLSYGNYFDTDYGFNFMPKVLNKGKEVDEGKFKNRFVYLSEYREDVRHMTESDLLNETFIGNLLDTLSVINEIQSDSYTVCEKYKSFIDQPCLSYWDMDFENIMVANDGGIFLPDMDSYEFGRQPFMIQNEFDFYLLGNDMDEFHRLYFQERYQEELDDQPKETEN